MSAIRALPEDALWRHNQAGDLYTRDQETIAEPELAQIVAANRGRRGLTYTHFDVEANQTNRELVRRANAQGFTINLSANSPEHADALADPRR